MPRHLTEAFTTVNTVRIKGDFTWQNLVGGGAQWRWP
jgi:hypothetical protein